MSHLPFRLDTLVFAGGIGENAPRVRSRICEGLGFLGIALDEKRNAATKSVISATTGRVEDLIRPQSTQASSRSLLSMSSRSWRHESE
jgi:acetate kinase